MGLSIQDVFESWKKSVHPKDDLEQEAFYIIGAALQKQIPEEPVVLQGWDTKKYYRCPECGKAVGLKVPYCRMCGQAIKWC